MQSQPHLSPTAASSCWESADQTLPVLERRQGLLWAEETGRQASPEQLQDVSVLLIPRKHCSLCLLKVWQKRSGELRSLHSPSQEPGLLQGWYYSWRKGADLLLHCLQQHPSACVIAAHLARTLHPSPLDYTRARNTSQARAGSLQPCVGSPESPGVLWPSTRGDSACCPLVPTSLPDLPDTGRSRFTAARGLAGQTLLPVC